LYQQLDKLVHIYLYNYPWLENQKQLYFLTREGLF
jgi:hypothetical protein